MHPIDRTHGRGLAARQLPLNSGIYPPGVGRCGDRAPSLVDMRPLHVCALPAGHAGWHRSDEGAEWTLRDGEPRSDLPEGQQSKGLVALVAEVMHRALDAGDENWHLSCMDPDGDGSCAKGHYARRMLAEDVAPKVIEAVVARVRAAVAEEIAEALDKLAAVEPAAYQYRHAMATAAAIARGRSGKGLPAAVGSPTPEVGTPEHRDAILRRWYAREFVPESVVALSLLLHRPTLNDCEHDIHGNAFVCHERQATEVAEKLIGMGWTPPAEPYTVAALGAADAARLAAVGRERAAELNVRGADVCPACLAPRDKGTCRWCPEVER